MFNLQKSLKYDQKKAVLIQKNTLENFYFY